MSQPTTRRRRARELSRTSRRDPATRSGPGSAPRTAGLAAGLAALLALPVAGTLPTARAGPPAPGPWAAPTRQASQGRFVRADRIITLEMEVPVEPEVVFDAWARADLLVEWFCHWVEDMSVTEGGTYRLGWDGVEAEWTGEFLEVERPGLLVFTWNPPEAFFAAGAYPTTVRLTFEDLDGTTRMVLRQSGFRGSEEMESHLQQWTSYLYTLRAFLLQRTRDERAP